VRAVIKILQLNKSLQNKLPGLDAGFAKKKLPQLPHSVFVREERHGLCRLKVKL